MKYKGTISDPKDLVTKEYVDLRGVLAGTSFPASPSNGDKFLLTQDESDDAVGSFSGHYVVDGDVASWVAAQSSRSIYLDFVSNGSNYDMIYSGRSLGITYGDSTIVWDKDSSSWTNEAFKYINFPTTQTPESGASDLKALMTKIKCKAGVYVYNSTTYSWVCIADHSEAVSVDDTTIEKNSEGKLQVKDGAITYDKVNSSLMTETIPDEDPSITKLTKESAVKSYVDNRPDENILTYDSTSHKYTLKPKTTSDKGKSWVVDDEGNWQLTSVIPNEETIVYTSGLTKTIDSNSKLYRITGISGGLGITFNAPKTGLRNEYMLILHIGASFGQITFTAPSGYTIVKLPTFEASKKYELSFLVDGTEIVCATGGGR